MKQLGLMAGSCWVLLGCSASQPQVNQALAPVDTIGKSGAVNTVTTHVVTPPVKPIIKRDALPEGWEVSVMLIVDNDRCFGEVSIGKTNKRIGGFAKRLVRPGSDKSRVLERITCELIDADERPMEIVLWLGGKQEEGSQVMPVGEYTESEAEVPSSLRTASWTLTGLGRMVSVNGQVRVWESYPPRLSAFLTWRRQDN